MRKKTRISPPTSSMEYCTGGSVHSSQARTKIKSIQIREEEVKLSLFRRHDAAKENPKEPTTVPSEPIKEFNNIAGYKIKVEK